MAQRAPQQAAGLVYRSISQGAEQLQQQCGSTVLQPLRQHAASTVIQQQPCSGLHMLPRLRMTQPLRSQAVCGRRHMLMIANPTSSCSTSSRGGGGIASSSHMHGGAGTMLFSTSSAFKASGSRQLPLSASPQRCWRAWVKQQLGSGSSTTTTTTTISGRRLFSTAGAAGAAPIRAAAGSSSSMWAAPPSWGAGVSSWFNTMPAAAAWWDSWSLWVNQHASFMMAALLNSLNTVGNKLPGALGLLLVDFIHNSPLLHGSRADALVLPDTLPEGSFYAAGGPAGKAAASSSSGGGGLAQALRNAGSNAAAVWGEVLAGLSAGARLLWLGAIWLPALLSAPLLLGWLGGRCWWLGLMTMSLEASGPAFIKWGQWAATRHDLFAHDVCEALEKLHTQAPAHSFRYTCMALHKSFDLPPDQLFDWIEEVPIACGSIGQVHRARLSEKGAALTCCAPGEVVAVKVRHPGVCDAIERDFQTMVWVTHVATQLFPSIRTLRLEDTLKQFAAPLHEQVDLSREAANLQRFNTNFRRTRSVSFPEPLYPLVSPDVLVESFEAGKHISVYITGQQGSDPYRARLAELGSGTMLQMMLVDNLIHSDLHPGNILVRLEHPHGLVGVAYKAVTALANPEGPAMKALGSALESLQQRKQGGGVSDSTTSGSESSSSSSSSDAGAVGGRPVEVVAVVEEVIELPPPAAAAASSSSNSSKSDSSNSDSSKGCIHSARVLASQLQRAWSAGGPSALLQVVQSRLRGMAAGWLQPHIVLLDVGMATELSPEDQTNMVGLFRSFAALDGRDVARWVLRFSGSDQSCEDPQAFMEDVASTFETLKKTIAAQEAARERWEEQQQQQQQQQQQAGNGAAGAAGGSGLIEMPEQFDSGFEALSTVLELVRLHGVSLPGHIAGCVVTTLILEGWSNKLAPEHSVLSQVQSMFSPALLPWGSRMDSVVDTVMDRNDTALVMT